MNYQESSPVNDPYSFTYSLITSLACIHLEEHYDDSLYD